MILDRLTSETAVGASACLEDERVLRFGLYACFDPVTCSAEKARVGFAPADALTQY